MWLLTVCGCTIVLYINIYSKYLSVNLCVCFVFDTMCLPCVQHCTSTVYAAVSVLLLCAYCVCTLLRLLIHLEW